MKYPHKKPKRGSILVTLLFLVCVLALLVATVANDSLQTLKSVAQSGRDTQAKYAAYAGMELVMNQLRLEERFIGDPIDMPNHGKKHGDLDELNKVTYDVLIWNNMRDSEAGTGPPEDPIVTPDGVTVRPDTVYMVSTGTDTARGEEVVLTTMAGTARRVRPVFEDAAYARSKMMLLGDSLVDAWDSGGGWNPYIGGDFPGDTSGSDSGGGGGPSSPDPPEPTVQDHKATLGTDSASDRTLRMLGSSKLNGHYRIGPGVTDEGAFSDDSGTTSTSGGFTSSSSGDTTTSFGVATAVDPVTQIAGVEPGGGIGSEAQYHKLDDKTTEMPRFTAPYDTEDLLPPPTVSNPPGTQTIPPPQGSPPGTPSTVISTPPPPVTLAPGGYVSIDVPGDQTLSLEPGVYYFQEEMKVSGKIELTGSDPVVVFIGKKAVFNSAEINKEGKTSSLQLCFTDEEKDPLKIAALVDSLLPYFELPESASATTADDGGGLAGLPTTTTAASAASETLEEYVKRLVAPGDATNPETQEGASTLEINGGNFYGSISGKNLVVEGNGGEVFGGIMANVVRAENTDIHQDLALKGSNLMNAGGWALEGVHQVR